uniref:Uncharacterized protein n=1 Tax=Panagrolaimus superbus TaxID=310955 RepID=A0A914YS88_9BILA
MPVATGLGQHRQRVGHPAQPVQHAGMAEHAGAAQRQAQHGAQVVLELRSLAAFDGPVAGVVHARRHLVGQQLTITAEQLQREHADVLQVFGNATGIADRCLPLGVGQHGRGHTGRQQAVDMPVAGDRPRLEAAIAAAHGDHADLALEGHEAFQDQSGALDLRAQRVPRGIDVGFVAQAELPLAVVAQAAVLEDARQAEFGGLRRQLVTAADVGEGRQRNAIAGQGFSLNRSWATASAAGGG